MAGTIPANVDHDGVSAATCAPAGRAWSARWCTPARSSARLRVLSLLALDFAALLGAIFTALAFKELVRGNFVFSEEMGTRRWSTCRSCSS